MLHRKRNRAWTLAIFAMGFWSVAPVWGAVVADGDTTPPPLLGFNEITVVGRDGTGTLTINGGSKLTNSTGFIGYYVGSAGAATVTGTGSTWTNTDSLWVGRLGSGTLTVTNGGLVSTKTLWASLSDLHGNGTITAAGAVLDANLIFDSSHRTTQIIPFGSGGSLKLAIGGSSNLGVGYHRD